MRTNHCNPIQGQLDLSLGVQRGLRGVPGARRALGRMRSSHTRGRWDRTPDLCVLVRAWPRRVAVASSRWRFFAAQNSDTVTISSKNPSVTICALRLTRPISRFQGRI
eukprot:6935354-Prymnesium_polylepis.2